MKNDLATLRRIADAAATYMALQDAGADNEAEYGEWEASLCVAITELRAALEAREAT